MEILASLQEPIHIHSGLKGHKYVPIAALTYPHLILSVDIPTSQPKHKHNTSQPIDILASLCKHIQNTQNIYISTKVYLCLNLCIHISNIKAFATKIHILLKHIHSNVSSNG